MRGQSPAALSAERFDAELDAAVDAAETPVGNTPGADFVLGEPLTEGRQAEILASSADTVARSATRLAEINAEIDARVTEAREVSDPAFMETEVTLNPIPGFPGTETQRFNETLARETISADYGAERAMIEAETQSALSMAALVDPQGGLDAMRDVATQALEATGLPEPAQAAVLDSGVLSQTGYHRADAFRRAADAWAEGSGDMASHPLDPSATTAEYVAANPQNPYIAASLDDILSRLSDNPALADDMRLYATSQLGAAIYNAETRNYGALMSQIEAGRATSGEALALQEDIGATEQGRQALRQFQALFSPADLANQHTRTGEMENRGVLNFRPGTPENPMGGYPDVIRNTIGEGIDAAMDARGVAAVAMAATVAIPGPEDLAFVAGGRVLGGMFRGSRIGDEALDAASQALRPVRQQLDTPPAIAAAQIPPVPSQPVARADGLQPGTAEHKLNRWEHYASNRDEPISYERWSALYDRNVTATQDAAQRAADYVAETGFGVPNTRGFEVEVDGQMVTRYPDVIDRGLAEVHELKSGYQYLTDDIRQQIAADVAVREQRGLATTWVFDIRDGANAPSQPLLSALDDANIPYQILRP